MILSDEPGLYLNGAYGIRLENLLLVQEADFPDARKKFLRFETLTLAPFDRALIDAAQLEPAARDWLNAYHARVREALSPLLAAQPAVQDWLRRATAPI
jgi:Xaa-Pro aminopeptidase